MNSVETELPLWMRAMASANSEATLSTFRPGKFSGAGTVLVETTSEMWVAEVRRSTAEPENRPWVQANEASKQPKSASRDTISTID